MVKLLLLLLADDAEDVKYCCARKKDAESPSSSIKCLSVRMPRWTKEGLSELRLENTWSSWERRMLVSVGSIFFFFGREQ